MRLFFSDHEGELGEAVTTKFTLDLAASWVGNISPPGVPLPTLVSISFSSRVSMCSTS